jgi:hypothetical protein
MAAGSKTFRLRSSTLPARSKSWRSAIDRTVFSRSECWANITRCRPQGAYHIGNIIFNRVSYKLKQRRIVNHPDTRVGADGVFPSIIDRALFERARAIIDQRSLLQAVLDEEGSLSGLIIDERDGMTSSHGVGEAPLDQMLRENRFVDSSPVHSLRQNLPIRSRTSKFSIWKHGPARSERPVEAAFSRSTRRWDHTRIFRHPARCIHTRT